MDDPVEVILRNLKNNHQVKTTRFTSSFLNTVGDVLDQEGFGATKTFLMDRMGRRDTGFQARIVLKMVLPVLEASDKVRARRSIGRYIIKTLNTLKEVDL